MCTEQLQQFQSQFWVRMRKKQEKKTKMLYYLWTYWWISELIFYDTKYPDAQWQLNTSHTQHIFHVVYFSYEAQLSVT